MLPQRLPEPVHPDALDIVSARWRRASGWLWAATLLQIGLSVGGVITARALVPPDNLVSVCVGVILCPVLAWLYEYRNGMIRKPTVWGFMAATLSMFPAAVCAYAIGALVPVPGQVFSAVGGVLGFALVHWLHVRADRCLTVPMVAELAGSSFVLSPKIDRGTLRRAAEPEILLTLEKLTWTTPLTTRANGKIDVGHIALKFITSVARTPTRIVVCSENPGHFPPREAWIASVRPEIDAELVRVRAGFVTGRPLGPVRPRAEPTVTAPPGVPPELLPVPDPIGAATTPTDSPADPARPAEASWPWLILGALGTVGIGAVVLVRAALTVTGPTATWTVFGGVVAATVTWVGTGVLLRDRPRYWALPALGVAVLTNVVAALAATRSITPAAGIHPLWAVATCVLAFMLTRAAGTRLSQVHTGHRHTGTHLSFGGRYATLSCDRERLTLRARSTESVGEHTVAMALTEVELVQPGEVTIHRHEVADTDIDNGWPHPGLRRHTLWVGSALRIVGGGQQWMVQISDPATVSEIIRGRASRAVRAAPRRLELVEWRTVRQWQGGVEDELGYSLAGSAVILGSVLMFLSVLLVAAGLPTGDPDVADVGRVSIPAAVVLLWFGLRRYRRLHSAQHVVLPLGAPPWGEQRWNRAPFPGWRPWTDHSGAGRFSNRGAGSASVTGSVASHRP